MIYSESLKTGFRIINTRWQLVAVQTAMILFNCIGFFIMVGIPLGIAFVIFGLDLTGLSELRDVFEVIRHPADLLSKYFGLVLIVVTSFLLYLLLITTIGLYVFSGSVGIIGRTFLDPSAKFSMKGFFSEAKRLFFPLMWFTCIVGIFFLAVAFILGLFGGGAAAVVSAAKGMDSTLGLFLGIFFSLLSVLIGLGIILVTLAIAVYGIAVLFFKGEGPMKSFRGAVAFLWNKPNAFWLYVIIFLGYILASFMLMLVVYPFNLIPIVGTIISFPFQLLSYAIQGYLGLVIIAIVFSYYFESEIKDTTKQEEIPEEAGETGGTTSGGSIQDNDISVPQAPEQETTPRESEGNGLT